MRRSRLEPPSSVESGLECMAADSRDLSPIKLSRPQKRRKRSEKSAVRKALIHTTGLKAELGLEEILSSPQIHEVHSITARLEAMEAKLDVVISALYPLHWGSCDVTAPPSPSNVKPSSSALNPSAPVFEPRFAASDNPESDSFPMNGSQKVCSASATRMRETEEVSAGTCRKCGERLDSCLCFDLYCRCCLRYAENCECDSPYMYDEACTSCGKYQCEDSLFDDDRLPSLPSRERCRHCQSPLQGAMECGHCLRVDAQGALDECSGLCELQYHRFCMKAATRKLDCGHDPPIFICHSCSAAGKEVVCVMCGMEDQDTEEKPTAQQWLQDEIKVWVQVTLKIAHASAEQGTPLDQCVAQIERRWDNAKPHIHTNLHNGIEEILAGIRNSTANILCEKYLESMP